MNANHFEVCGICHGPVCADPEAHSKVAATPPSAEAFILGPKAANHAVNLGCGHGHAFPMTPCPLCRLAAAETLLAATLPTCVTDECGKLATWRGRYRYACDEHRDPEWAERADVYELGEASLVRAWLTAGGGR